MGKTTGSGSDVSPLIKAAEVAVKRLTRPYKIMIALLVVLILALSVVVYRGRQLTETVQNGAITSCEATNARSAADIAHWDLFLGLLLKGQTNKTALAEGAEIEASVAKSDAPRDCTAIYGAG
jgi:hypothetical protein